MSEKKECPSWGLPRTPTPEYKEKLKVYLALASYTGLWEMTHTCILRDLNQLNCPETGLEVHYRTICNDALIDRARSRIATGFVNNELNCDVLVMIDYDVEWRGRARQGAVPWEDMSDLEYIAKKAYETQAIIGGIVSKRNRGQGLAIDFCKEFQAEHKDKGVVFPIGKDELIRASWVGAAFTAYPRAAVKAVQDTMPFTVQGFYPMFMPMCFEIQEGTHAYLSEDWAFCKRCMDLGFDTYGALKPMIKHHGHYSYTVKDAFAKQEEEKILDARKI